MIRFKKRHIKGKKRFQDNCEKQMDFAQYLRISDVSENNKVYYGRFLRNGFG